MRKRMTLALAAAGAITVVAAGAVSVAARSTTPQVAGTPSRAAARVAGTTVTLPTGDKITVRSDGAGHHLATPADPKIGPFLTERLNGDDYFVPLRAVRQLGTAFDLARFDVSALLRGETAAPPAAHPDFPMRTVTLTVLGPDGGPVDSAFLDIVNVDDSRKYQSSIGVGNGGERISVPDGHYGVLVAHSEYGADGTETGNRMGFAEFTVAGAATAVTVDALRTATNQVSVDAPPKPADTEMTEVSWYRGSDDQSAVSMTFSVGGEATGYTFIVGTSPAPAVGVQHFAVHERWVSPAGTTDPYAYDVTYPTDGAIGADQHYRIDTKDLATVDNRYHSDLAGLTGVDDTQLVLSWQTGDGFFWIPNPVSLPTHRVEYVTGNPEVMYWHVLQIDTGSELVASGYHRYRPGQHVTVDWRQAPVVPGFPADSGLRTYVCWACRTGDTLRLFVSQLTDSEPDHNDSDGWNDRYSFPSAHFQLYQGDTKLADLTGATGGTFSVGPEQAAYRLVYDQDRPDYSHSTSSHTEWTFQSQHSGATTVPDRWACDPSGGHTDCSALSLLTLNYALPQGLDDTVAAGRQRMELTVGHTAGSPAVAVRTATVAYSLDGGTTWTPATALDQGHGRYRVTWNLPASAAGKKVSLAVTATDAAGNTVRQTVSDAVTVS